MKHHAWACASAACLLLFSAVSQAHCSVDTECKGGRVCEAGGCVAPALESPAKARAVAATTAPAAGAETGLANARAGYGSPTTERANKALMVGGIIMVSMSPLLLLGALMESMDYAGCSYDLDKRLRDGTQPLATAAEIDRCEQTQVRSWGLAIGGALLVGGGVPMIVIGGKRVPVTESGRAIFVPWASPSAAGLNLRLNI